MSNLYAGKVTLDKVITFHERHLFMLEHQSNSTGGVAFHNEAIKLLKKLKEKTDVSRRPKQK